MAEHTPAPTPARSLYGFILYLFSKTALTVYCIWAFVPDYFLHYFNIYYYPDKYWSTAIPIQCLVALTLFAFLIYPSSNFMLTRNIDSYNTIADPVKPVSTRSSSKEQKTHQPQSATDQCICADQRNCVKLSFSNVKESTVPSLQDLDFRFVCRKLYLNTHK
ncbi:PREDICTED: phosphatidylinositol N-acetylglucosaminyltransferase subunit P [Papilio xuthus]|uniref:Phosphatidylinositol N-acetylglucosaminyltransferase subunit P n=1 Tax=Papilio xuthus TaxID=66420 RepID=A0AAJ7EL83_PAPXU|nr:PREDICTED: phosphatidylinositol N-acetylglucosaminyltransferase subunit P [Papilio xuthus]XP_013181996.1 PREDICTED: phosphatidylinositol N-acetylglucosaminyltransferase subunit P [Papilio xuthus]